MKRMLRRALVAVIVIVAFCSRRVRGEYDEEEDEKGAKKAPAVGPGLVSESNNFYFIRSKLC